MADDEGSFVDAPEAFAAGEFGELGDLDAGEAEDGAGGLGFVVGLVVEDAGGGVAKEALGEAARDCDPASPTASRSESRWTTMRFASPQARDSFHWACMRASRAGWARSRQASS